MLLLIPVTPLRGEVFQWIDSRGVIHFTDNLHSVPEALRGSLELIIREDFDTRAGSSEKGVAEEEPVLEPKAPEVVNLPEPEATKAPQPIIHYNPQHFNIVVVHSIVRRPKEKRCLIPEGCKPAFRPNFDDRRYIHPSAFNGGPQQYIQPQLFPPARR